MLKNKKLIMFTTLGSLLFMNSQTVVANEPRPTVRVESEMALTNPLEESFDNSISNEQKQETITSPTDNLVSENEDDEAVLPMAAGVADIYRSADYWTAVND
ncbi:hypothetical protein [Lactococcus sp.]|uniref:hypothetical protein n=1 Tax=Lactococcus sp. TaxID=44273 RepID=UPI0035B28CC9